MPTNKHALIRYRVIDRCLRNIDKQWNWSTLAAACAQEIQKTTNEKVSLSERTIKGDISSMRTDEALGYYAPIEYDRKEKSYYYSNRNFSITEAPLNKSDSNELKSVLSMLRQFTGFRHLEGIENIIHKLEMLVYESRGEEKQIVQIEQASNVPGQEWLDELYKAIQNETALTLSYKAFNKEESSFVISPYLLKEYKNRWFLYAQNHSKSALRTYGLERITALRPSLQKYKVPKNFNPEAYFRDIIGVGLDPTKKPVEVVLEIKGNTVHYFNTQKIHHSQRLLDKAKNKSTFGFTLIPNYELESIILSYGEDVKVIKPLSLKNKIIKRVKHMQVK